MTRRRATSSGRIPNPIFSRNQPALKRTIRIPLHLRPTCLVGNSRPPSLPTAPEWFSSAGRHRTRTPTCISLTGTAGHGVDPPPSSRLTRSPMNVVPPSRVTDATFISVPTVRAGPVATTSTSRCPTARTGRCNHSATISTLRMTRADPQSPPTTTGFTSLPTAPGPARRTSSSPNAWSLRPKSRSFPGSARPKL